MIDAYDDDEPLFSFLHKNEAVILEHNESRMIFRILSPLSMSEKLELYTMRLKYVSVLENKPHTSDTKEFLTVIARNYSVKVNTKKAVLKEGDTIHFHADVCNIIKNENDF